MLTLVALVQTTSNYRMTEGWILNSKPVYYVTKEQPAVWFSPREVWEIRGAGMAHGTLFPSFAWVFFQEQVSHVLTDIFVSVIR